MSTMALGGMLLSSLLWTAGTTRSEEQGSLDRAAGGISFSRTDSRFKIGYEHARRLCTGSAIETGCDVLGALRDGETALASAQQLAEVLAASVDDVNDLLHTLLGDYNLENEEFDVRDLCEKAVLQIPSILGMAAPQNPGLGCVEDECVNESIDITEEALSQSDLATVPPPQTNDMNKSEDIGPIEPDDPAVRGRALFRGALNVVFGIFPAVDENNDETTSSLLQEQADADGPGADVAFGSRIRRDRHTEYRVYAMKASAWISTALRRIRSGRSITKKWFILRSEAQIDAQTIEARKHLMKMLTAIGSMKLRKGASDVCTVTKTRDGESGTLAFVRATLGCNVQSTNSCGEGRSCSSCGHKEQGRYVVNICEFYWRNFIDQAQRVGTIVHESSHHFGTDDKAYCSAGGCLRLSSANARDNADSYTHYVKELVKSTWLTGESLATDAVPHPSCNTGCSPTQFTSATQDWRVKYRLPLGSCGKCKEISHVKIGPLKLWGDDCEGLYEKAKSSATQMLCCKSYKCFPPTTTTSTLLIPVKCPYPAKLSMNHFSHCECPHGRVCSPDGSKGGCGYHDEKLFDVSCRTCACYRTSR